MDINYYLVVGDCALFANVLKVELSKELSDEKLNDFFKHDFEDMLRSIHNDLIVNGKESTEFNRNDIYLEMWLCSNETYGISINLTNKDGVKKTMQFDKAKFVLQSKYRYHNITPKEPFILEPEDWSEEEWKVLLKLFGLQEADRIKVYAKSIESFGILKGDKENDENTNKQQQENALYERIRFVNHGMVLKKAEYSEEEWKFILKLFKLQSSDIVIMTRFDGYGLVERSEK